MIIIDPENSRVIVRQGEVSQEYQIGSPEAFAIISAAWLRSGWDSKYVYSFTWLGRPIIQLPEDMFRIQEVICEIKPDVIIETGIAHGGSMIFYASLCQALGKGKVIGVDIEIRPHNREAIETHALFPFITLLEGSSTDPNIIDQLRSHIKPNDVVMVLLDSNHTRDHVFAELEAYSPLVSLNSYIVVMDGIMEDLVGAPRTQPDWSWNNPRQAAHEFVKSHPNFEVVEPAFLFNEGSVAKRVTYWPDGFIKRVR